MRQSGQISIAQQFGQAVTDSIARFGEDLTVTRPADGTARIVRFLPQPQGGEEANTLLAEGLWNLSEPMPHCFVCAEGSDVQEKDTLVYAGQTWRILTVTPTRLSGGAVGIECPAVREK